MPANISAGLSVLLLLTDDTDSTAAFYRDLLGVPLQGEIHGGRHKHYACRLGSVYFTIQLGADLAAPPNPKGYDHLQLCFTVPDMDAFMKHLEEVGVVPLHDPKPFEGTTFITLLDPDRRHVRVMTPWNEATEKARA